MVKRSLLFHPKVPGEVRAFLDHYSSISVKLADSFWKELTEAFESVRESPEQHHIDTLTGCRRLNLKRFPIHILFRVFPNAIRITAVRHNRQNPRYGSKRR